MPYCSHLREFPLPWGGTAARVVSTFGHLTWISDSATFAGKHLRHTQVLDASKDITHEMRWRKAEKELADNEAQIVKEFLAVEGTAQDVGGYFHPDDAKASVAMRPSATLNKIVDSM